MSAAGGGRQGYRHRPPPVGLRLSGRPSGRVQPDQTSLNDGGSGGADRPPSSGSVSVGSVSVVWSFPGDCSNSAGPAAAAAVVAAAAAAGWGGVGGGRPCSFRGRGSLPPPRSPPPTACLPGWCWPQWSRCSQGTNVTLPTGARVRTRARATAHIRAGRTRSIEYVMLEN